MKLRLILISTLIGGGLFAQGFGRHGQGANSGSTHTPPTPAQLAAQDLTRIARLLRLDSADTSKLTGNSSLVGFIEAEQTTLQANATMLKTAYTALATDIAGNNTSDAAVQETTIQTNTVANQKARVTAATQVVGALPGAGLSVTLTSTQLASVARALIGGGGPGGGRGRF